MYLLVQKSPAPKFKHVYPIEFYQSVKMANRDAKRMAEEYKGTSKFEVWIVEVKGHAEETVLNT